MKAVEWVQFTWDLNRLPSEAPAFDGKRYTLDMAGPEDAALLDAALERSYSMEQGWSLILEERLNYLKKLVHPEDAKQAIDFIVIRHGSRIIAASGIAEQHESGRNLVTGICVLNEYRCRGLGAYLLDESLRRLKAKGMTSARVITKKGIAAYRYLYPKLGGVETPLATEVAA
jgi:ribosomal protein S18 acetylase RimI-like enzyme